MNVYPNTCSATAVTLASLAEDQKPCGDSEPTLFFCSWESVKQNAWPKRGGNLMNELMNLQFDK